jgi:predicted HAD superfamily phosphohydrolase
MTKTYTVSTITEIDGRIATEEVGTYADKVKAMNVAKRAAHTRKDCETYGPTSLAYIGKDITAVVAW